MPKLAIYVPKKDMREIEKWRKKINFSRVFMKALFQEIRDRSRTVDASEGQLAAAAEYYKRKFVECSGPLVDFGHQLGGRHVIDCRLAPESIRRVVELEAADAFQPEEAAVIEEAIGGDLSTIDDFLQKQGYGEHLQPTCRSVVYRGYAKGVAAAWRRVCERM